MMGPFLPLFLSVVASAAVGALGSRLRPNRGAWLMSVSIGAALATILATSWAVSLGLLAHAPIGGDLFAWCLRPLGVHHRLSPWVALLAVVVAGWSTSRVWTVARSWRRQRGSLPAGVQVVELELPLAYAETGRAGGVVVSTGMLAALEPDERRALLAHEQAHLAHRHDRFLVVGRVAEGLPPLLPAARQLRQSLERWADEVAAGTLGDRAAVARAVARAALVSHARGASVLGMLGADVPARVEALLRPPTRGLASGSWTILAVVIVATSLVAVAVQLHHLAAVLSAICPG